MLQSWEVGILAETRLWVRFANGFTGWAWLMMWSNSARPVIHVKELVGQWDNGIYDVAICNTLYLCFGMLLLFLHWRKFDKTQAELHPIPVKADVWHTVGVDLIGPLPETPRGNKYIMTVSCLFSKWPEATALPDKCADGVAEFLFKCFTRHGCCKIKISDQGREFNNKVLPYGFYCFICQC